jgi:chemotaxis protein CheY-P-specific phosphatase CheC
MWRLEEIVTFNLLFYVHRYHQLKDELDDMRGKLVMEASNQTIQTLTQALIKIEQEKISLEKIKENLKISQEDCKKAKKLDEIQQRFQQFETSLRKTIEEKASKIQEKESTISILDTAKQVYEKKSKDSPSRFTWFFLGMTICFLLQKGYAYCF